MFIHCDCSVGRHLFHQEQWIIVFRVSGCKFSTAMRGVFGRKLQFFFPVRRAYKRFRPLTTVSISSGRRFIYLSFFFYLFILLSSAASLDFPDVRVKILFVRIAEQLRFVPLPVNRNMPICHLEFLWQKFRPTHLLCSRRIRFQYEIIIHDDSFRP